MLGGANVSVKKVHYWQFLTISYFNYMPDYSRDAYVLHIILLRILLCNPSKLFVVDEGFLVRGHVFYLGDHLPDHWANTTFSVGGAQDHSSSCNSGSSPGGFAYHSTVWSDISDCHH